MLKHPLVQAGLSATELVAAQLEVKKTLMKENERGRAPVVVLCGAGDTPTHQQQSFILLRVHVLCPNI